MKKRSKSQLLTPFKSIGTNILFYFSLLIVITLTIFSLISIRYTENTVMSNSIDYTGRLIEQVNRDIDSYISYMENISYMVSRNSDVESYLFEKSSEEEAAKLEEKIITQFATITETRSDITNIGIIGTPDRTIINSGKDQLNPYVDFDAVDWYRGALKTKENVLASSHVQNAIQNNYKWVVTLSRGIENKEKDSQKAVFFIDLNYRLLKDLCENNSLGSKSYLFIIDERGKLIYHPKQQLLYSGLKSEKIQEVLDCEGNYFVARDGESDKLYTISVSEKTGWSVVGVADLKDLMKNKEETQALYGIVAVLLLFTAVLISMFLSAAITRPIKELKESMKEVERGNFEKAGVMVRSENEIGSLGNSFNLMTERIAELMKEIILEQKAKRKSELKALRSQINPHFLYNTLDSIIWMAEGGKNAEVVRMTAALAKLLRQSISNDEEMITLKKELEHTGSYLTIQKMRYKDKLEYEVEIAPDALEEKVINLILQPLVENAIYHGIKYKKEKGLIRITGELEDDWLVIRISDNGVGMNRETLNGILTEREDPAENGVGVHNVHMRIRLYYGEGSGLSFISEEGVGTTVTIRIKRGNGREEE